VRSGIRSIRAAARELRPALLDDLGLIPALRALADDFADTTDLEVTAELASADGLSEDAELALYRSLQEGLSNVARHARGVTRVEVRLGGEPDAVVLEVRDDGTAAEAAVGEAGRSGTGLLGMRERIAPLGGSVDLRRTARGARLRVRIPRGRAV